MPSIFCPDEMWNLSLMYHENKFSLSKHNWSGIVWTRDQSGSDNVLTNESFMKFNMLLCIILSYKMEHYDTMGRPFLFVFFIFASDLITHSDSITGMLEIMIGCLWGWFCLIMLIMSFIWRAYFLNFCSRSIRLHIGSNASRLKYLGNISNINILSVLLK